METIKMKLTEKDNHSEKITALYCRLALRETESGESEGIRQQKILLEQYASEHGFSNIQFYIDDGYSGLNFATRPALNRLLGDIEAGIIGTVIVKDLSRLGRDYPKIKNRKYSAVVKSFFQPEKPMKSALLLCAIQSREG